VILSVSGHTELPVTIQAWLDLWLWLLDKERPALVALFDSSAPRNIPSIRTYLSCITRRDGIDFFPYEIHSAVSWTGMTNFSNAQNSSKRTVSPVGKRKLNLTKDI
jgi:hypothetical protein